MNEGKHKDLSIRLIELKLQSGTQFFTAHEVAMLLNRIRILQYIVTKGKK